MNYGFNGLLNSLLCGEQLRMSRKLKSFIAGYRVRMFFYVCAKNNNFIFYKLLLLNGIVRRIASGLKKIKLFNNHFRFYKNDAYFQVGKNYILPWQA